MKETIRSFQEWTREDSRLVYQVTAAPVRLSWKKCINNFSSFAYAPIFLLYTFRWFLGKVVPLYLSKSLTLNFGGMTTSGTRYNYAMLAKAWSPFPSMALSFSSIWSNFPFFAIAGGTLPVAKWKGCGCGRNWGSSKLSGRGTPPTACPSMAYPRRGSKLARLWWGISCASLMGWETCAWSDLGCWLSTSMGVELLTFSSWVCTTSGGV